MVSWGWVEFTNGADLVGSVAGNTDIPVAFKNDLDVFDVKGVGATEFSHLAGGCGDVVDEFVDEFENRLWRVVSENAQIGGDGW